MIDNDTIKELIDAGEWTTVKKAIEANELEAQVKAEVQTYRETLEGGIGVPS